MSSQTSQNLIIAETFTDIVKKSCMPTESIFSKDFGGYYFGV